MTELARPMTDAECAALAQAIHEIPLSMTTERFLVPDYEDRQRITRAFLEMMVPTEPEASS